MLDIKFIRENKDIVALAVAKKRIDFKVDELLAIDDKRRTLLSAVEAHRAEQNSASAKIASAISADERVKLIADMKVVKTGLETDEANLKQVMVEWQGLMLRVPNIPDISVPDGVSDADNKETKVWGEKPVFSF